MKRRIVFLAACAAQAVRPFLMGVLAIDLRLADSGGALSAFLRYLAVPQVAVSACFFFLWLDEARHADFRPLALLLQGLSLVAAVPAVASVVANAGSLRFGSADLLAVIVRLAILAAIDLAGILVLLLCPSNLHKEEPPCPQ